jgi:hypothetical protein
MASAPPQQNQQFDLSPLAQFKHQLEQLNEQKKGIKANHDALEKKAVDIMLQNNIRYVEEQGADPKAYWCLSKAKSEGSFKKERFMEFFTLLLRALEANRLTPSQCTEMALGYLAQFQKRSLKLERVSQPRGSATCEELKLWLAGKMD